jgi:hypothetical protein
MRGDGPPDPPPRAARVRRCAGKTLPRNTRFIDGHIGPAIDDDAALVAR